MGRDAIHIRGDDIRLGFVTRDIFWLLRVQYRIYEPEQFPRTRGVASHGKGHNGPNRRMGVLAAIFTDAGDVALDVAGFERRFIEGWIGQLNESGFAPDEPVGYCIESGANAILTTTPERTAQL